MIPFYFFAVILAIFVVGYLVAVAWRKHLLRNRTCSDEIWLRSFEVSPRITLPLAKQILGPIALASGCNVTDLRPSDSLFRSPLALSGVGELLRPPSDLVDDLDDAIQEALGEPCADAVQAHVERIGEGWTLGDVMRAVDAFMAAGPPA